MTTSLLSPSRKRCGRKKKKKKNAARGRIAKIFIGIAILDRPDGRYMGDRISRRISGDPGSTATEIRDMKSPRYGFAIEKTRRRMKVSYGMAAKPH